MHAISLIGLILGSLMIVVGIVQGMVAVKPTVFAAKVPGWLLTWFSRNPALAKPSGLSI